MKDCLNTIRLLAALQVLVGHTCAHLNIVLPKWLMGPLGFFWGVPIFFTLSGYLTWQSIGRSATFREYMLKRFWRIYPELWVAVLVEGIIVALLCSTIEWSSFFAFMVTQSTIFQFWTPNCLRSYGCGVPNGALWTICVLIQYYVGSYFIYKLFSGKRLLIWVLLLMASMVLSIGSRQILGEGMVSKLWLNSLFPYLWLFLIGCLVSEFRTMLLPVVKKYWYLFLLLAIFCAVINYDVSAIRYGIFRSLTLFLACLAIGYQFAQLNIKSDISYGIYIYHMIVVNVLIYLNCTNGYWLMLIIVVSITCLAAYISAKTIGVYCAKRKQTIVNCR